MIERVVLKNWRSHRETELRFGAGTNLLVGIMGSGKSSVLQAICYGLFGELPEIRDRTLKVEGLITRKPKASWAEVEVEFSLGGRKYLVKRRLERGRGTSHAEIREDGVLREAGSEKVTVLVAGLLDVNFETFTRVIYTRQNQLDEFLTLPKNRRRERIDELLHIDELEAARKTLTAIVGRAELKEESRKGLFQKFDHHAEKKLMEKLLAEKVAIEVELKEAVGQLEGLKESLKELKARETETKKVEETRQALLREIEGGKARVGQLEGRVAGLIGELPANPVVELAAALAEKNENDHNIETVQKWKTDLQENVGKIETLKSQKPVGRPTEELNSGLAAAERRRTELEKNGREIEEKLNGIRQEVLGTSRQLAISENELARKREQEKIFQEAAQKLSQLKPLAARLGRETKELAGKLAGGEAELAQIVNHLENLKDAAACPLCERELVAERRQQLEEKHRRRKETLEVEIANLRETLVELMTEEETRKTEIAALEAAEQPEKIGELAQRVIAHRQLLQSRQSEGKSLEGQLMEIRKFSQETSDRAAELKRKIEESRKAQQIQELIEALERQKKILEGKISELENKIKPRNALEEKIRFLEKAVEQAVAKTSLEKERRLLSSLEGQLAAAKTKWELEGLRDEIEKMQREAGELENMRAVLPQRLEEKTEILKNVERRLAEFEEQQVEIRRMQLVKERGQALQNTLLEVQTDLRRHFLEELNSTLEEVWKAIYPYGDFSSARFFVEAENAGDYSLQLKEGDAWIDVEGMASGGERALACLALRLALARVLVPHLSWLMLDEPTHNIDARGIQEFAVALRDRLAGLTDQIFLITHDEALEAAVSGFAYELERNKADGQPTQVKEISNPLSG